VGAPEFGRISPVHRIITGRKTVIDNRDCGLLGIPGSNIVVEASAEQTLGQLRVGRFESCFGFDRMQFTQRIAASAVGTSGKYHALLAMLMNRT
jgi:hypothetical protein